MFSPSELCIDFSGDISIFPNAYFSVAMCPSLDMCIFQWRCVHLFRHVYFSVAVYPPFFYPCLFLSGDMFIFYSSLPSLAPGTFLPFSGGWSSIIMEILRRTTCQRIRCLHLSHLSHLSFLSHLFLSHLSSLSPVLPISPWIPPIWPILTLTYRYCRPPPLYVLQPIYLASARKQTTGRLASGKSTTLLPSSYSGDNSYKSAPQLKNEFFLSLMRQYVTPMFSLFTQPITLVPIQPSSNKQTNASNR